MIFSISRVYILKNNVAVIIQNSYFVAYKRLTKSLLNKKIESGYWKIDISIRNLKIESGKTNQIFSRLKSLSKPLSSDDYCINKDNTPFT